MREELGHHEEQQKGEGEHQGPEKHLKHTPPRAKLVIEELDQGRVVGRRRNQKA